MTTTSQDRAALNGVDVPVLDATLDLLRERPDLAEFQFRARNEWVGGTHSRTAIEDFYGAGQEDGTRDGPFLVHADSPAVLLGEDRGPIAVEFLLHAIAACLTHGIANIAAARGITLHRVTSTVEGDLSLLGMVGIDTQVRSGYRQIRVHVTVEGDATAEELAAVVRRSQERSAVNDVLTHGTDVVVDVEGEPC